MDTPLFQYKKKKVYCIHDLPYIYMLYIFLESY